MASSEHIAPGAPGALGTPGPAKTTANATAAPTLWNDLLELTKPGITKLVLFSTGVGFAVAAVLYREHIGLWHALAAALWCALGTGLSASGANALNQWLEHTRDAVMPRTCARPIPAGRLSPRAGLAVGLLASIVGVGVLAIAVNPTAAAVSAVTILSYVLLYTPLKPVTSVATIVGAIPGALPPLIGWASVVPAGMQSSWHTLLAPTGWTLFAIMFLWQIPHFLAIAWMHREDYALGGHRVLPVNDPAGERTASICILWLIPMLPVSLAPVLTAPSLFGIGYSITATLLWIGFLYYGIGFLKNRTNAEARKLFFASIAYLPLLQIATLLSAFFSLLR